MAEIKAPEVRRVVVVNALLVLVYVAVQSIMLLDRGLIERDHEELFSAGQAWLALHGDLSSLLHMQYRPYCGGCTVHAVTAMGLFSALPPAWMAWKLIPLAWGAAGLVIGRRLLSRHVGAPAATAFTLLWLLPPRTFAALSLIAWGNHMEAGIMALGAAALTLGPGGRARRLVLGIWLGLSVYIGFSAAFSSIACAAWVAWRERQAGLLPLLVGLPIGLVGWAIQWTVAGQHAFHTIYEENESLPDPRRIHDELWTLLAPRQLAGLFGVPLDGAGVVLGVACAGALGAAVIVGRHTRAGQLSGLLIGAFLSVYAVTGFSVNVAEVGVMYPGGLRYAAALYPVAFLGVAAAAGWSWRQGRRLPAALLLAPWLVSGLWSRWDVLHDLAPDWRRTQREAVDWIYVRERLSFMVPMEAHERGAAAPDPRARAVHAYALGREHATTALREGRGPPPATGCAGWEGVGDALALHGLDRRAAESLLHSTPRADAMCALAQVHADDTGPAGPLTLAARDREAGLQWVNQTAPWAPTNVALPTATRTADWVFGVGQGLGERWGPLPSIPRPDGLTPDEAATLLDGYRHGQRTGWVHGRDAAAPALVP